MAKNILLAVIYTLVNGLFVFKYTTRFAGTYGYLFLVGYVVFVALLLYAIKRLSSNNKTELYAKRLFWPLFAITCGFILFLLFKIDPMDVRVDRWSATTYFLDAWFQGIYPYGVHTHVIETNFPSPFPLWHIINIPFWLMGDVGLGLLFFLSLTLFSIYSFSQSYWKTFLFLLLLVCSPAYWWEVAVRSDGLSNALLVFCCILWLQKKQITFRNHIVAMMIICGLVATTRLSAIVPMALYVFKSYTQLSWPQKIYVPLGILLVAACLFCPFVFWDTHEWVFFQRNPFMSQTIQANIFVLLIMMVVGAVVAYRIQTIQQFMAVAAVFMFAFMASSLLFLIDGRPLLTFLEHPLCDLSYLTLSFPYCIYALLPENALKD